MYVVNIVYVVTVAVFVSVADSCCAFLLLMLLVVASAAVAVVDTVVVTVTGDVAVTFVVTVVTASHCC